MANQIQTDPFVEIAMQDENWQQITASFALEGMPVTDEDSNRAGRIIAGVTTLEQAVEEIRKQYGYEPAES